MKITTCQGFKAAGIASGLKNNGKKDLGLIFSETSAICAGVFTQNKVQSAHVLLDKERIKSGICQAVIVNSGNANCCNGDQGMQDAKAMTNLTASALNISEETTLVASTGVIGKILPIKKIESAIPNLVNNLRSDGISDFAEAIMTTDTVPKTAFIQGHIENKLFTIIGVAKGVGMICPNMATMLSFVCTDINIDADTLKNVLQTSVNRSFNKITIDGDTSTNDTVIIMANGVSKASVNNLTQKQYFQNALDDVLINLSKQIVKDGEGATKFVEIIIKGALSDNEARKVAETIANSNLVKTALFGEDANWGRIIAAAGRAKASINPESIDIYFGDILMVKNGMSCGKSVEIKATQVLKNSEFSILIDLNIGNGSASVFTCDFSTEYVKINADYRS